MSVLAWSGTAQFAALTVLSAGGGFGVACGPLLAARAPLTVALLAAVIATAGVRLIS